MEPVSSLDHSVSWACYQIMCLEQAVNTGLGYKVALFVRKVEKRSQPVGASASRPAKQLAPKKTIKGRNVQYPTAPTSNECLATNNATKVRNAVAEMAQCPWNHRPSRLRIGADGSGAVPHSHSQSWATL